MEVQGWPLDVLRAYQDATMDCVPTFIVPATDASIRRVRAATVEKKAIKWEDTGLDRIY